MSGTQATNVSDDPLRVTGDQDFVLDSGPVIICSISAHIGAGLHTTRAWNHPVCHSIA